MKYTVSLQKCSSYNQSEVDSSVKKLLASLNGIGKFIRKGQKILLKPNLVKAASPQFCATTHPSVVEAVIKILKEHECDVIVGDCPFLDNSLKAMKACGIYDVCKKFDAKIAFFNKTIKTLNQNGLVVKEFALTHYFDEVDLIISLPKLKTHSQLYFTGAVKNLYSMMPGRTRGFFHFKYSDMEYFANMLLDLYALLRKKVALSITDGVYGMQGNGPCSGTAKFAGLLGASSDAIALDFIMCGLIGLDTAKMPVLYYAKKRKDFLFEPEKINVVGEKLSEIKIEPFAEAEHNTLNMMPKFVNNFKDYMTRHKSELVY